MKIFKELNELNDVEKNLKKYYKRHPEKHLDDPFLLQEFSNIPGLTFDFSHYLSNTDIKEQTFIQEELDCSFVRHFRYLPAKWHKHEFFEMLYVLHGSCQNIFQDHRISMSEGDICICAPGSIHAISAFTDDDLLVNVLLRKSTFEHAFMGLMEEDDILSIFFHRVLYQSDHIPYLLFHTKNEPELSSLLDKAMQEFEETHQFRRQAINVYLSEFFISLFRMHQQDIEVPTIARDNFNGNLIYILRYIQEHYATVSLKEAASFFNYSERHFERILEASTGMSFRETIQRQRMKRAEYLLQNTLLPIEQICEETGYHSANNFRRIFEKYHGCTPREYRKMTT